MGVAFLLFFCVLCGYFMLRPIRETIGTVLGEEEVADLFGATFLGCIAVIPIYGFAVARLPRAIVLGSVYAIFAISLLVLAAMLGADPERVGAARFFYVWISVFNLFIVSVFWTLMVDRSSSAQAKRSSSGSIAPMSSMTYMPPVEPRTVTSLTPRSASRKT